MKLIIWVIKLLRAAYHGNIKFIKFPLFLYEAIFENRIIVYKRNLGKLQFLNLLKNDLLE